MGNDLERRLSKAYYRRFGKNASHPSNTVNYIEKDGRTYAELWNVDGTLAVYRVKDDGSLKYVKKF